MRLRSLLAALALCTSAAPPALAADGPTLTARAGLEGVVRPGRWAPVVVTVETRTAGVAGELVLSWGDAESRHAINLAAPSTTTVTLYARTTDVRDAMTLSLEAGGARLHRRDLPVRVADSGDVLSVCVGAAAPDTACGITLDPAALPASPRALDAADTVTVAAAAVLSPAQRRALDFWRAARHVDGIGNGAPATGAVPQPAGRAHQARPATAGYLLLIVAAALTAATARRPALALAALPTAVAAGAVVAAFAGSARPIVIHHASIAEQFSGVDGARVVMRGIAEYPAARGALTAAACDAAIEVRSPRYELEPQRFGDDGCPRLEGPGQLGSARAFRLDAIAPADLLEGRVIDGRWRVTNVSSSTLHDCDLPAGFTPRRLAALPAGATVDAAAALSADAAAAPSASVPVVSCRLDAPPVALAARGPVVFNGTTVVVLHLVADGAAS